jgi:hypothetical protein
MLATMQQRTAGANRGRQCCVGYAVGGDRAERIDANAKALIRAFGVGAYSEASCLWSLNRLFRSSARRLMGGLEPMLPWGLCQL